MDFKNPKFILDKVSKYNFKSQKIIKTNDLNFLQTNLKPLDFLANHELINNFKNINDFHKKINDILNEGGIYLTCTETLEIRRKMRNKYPFGFKNIFRIIDFFFNRVCSKLPVLRNIYFIFTHGRYKVISKTETIGRLIACGFKILEHFEYKNRLYILSKKINKPKDKIKASNGLLCRFERIGYNGKTIGIYKIRTMYPYSEYLQSELFKLESLNKDGDKIENDFRVTTWGKYFRKFWIDEIPQILNIIKGDISIVGVRALSKEKFNLYNDELQNLRIKFKPGLLPPYYVDLPSNFNELQASEKKYLEKKSKFPFRTDFEYFFKIINNIIFKGARSS